MRSRIFLKLFAAALVVVLVAAQQLADGPATIFQIHERSLLQATVPTGSLGRVTASLRVLGWIAMLGGTVMQWRAHGFGQMNYATSLRLSIPGMTLTVLGFQTFLWSFFVSVLALKRR